MTLVFSYLSFDIGTCQLYCALLEELLLMLVLELIAGCLSDIIWWKADVIHSGANRRAERQLGRHT